MYTLRFVCQSVIFSQNEREMRPRPIWLPECPAVGGNEAQCFMISCICHTDWFPGTDILWETLKMLEYADPIGSPLTRESVGKRAGAHPGSHRAVQLSLHPEMHDRLIQSLEEFIIIRVFPFFRFQSAHLY